MTRVSRERVGDVCMVHNTKTDMSFQKLKSTFLWPFKEADRRAWVGHPRARALRGKCWLGNESKPLAVADWILKLTCDSLIRFPPSIPNYLPTCAPAPPQA